MVVLPMPPSVNTAYAGQTRRYKSKQYKEWEKKCENYNNTAIVEGNIKKEYIVTYRFFSIWYNKDGSIKTKDLHNYLKLIDDMLPKIIEGFDDAYIFQSRIEKIHSGREEVEVEIEELNIKKI
jgi:Holliday junction resolvase RusA-like endonuclease